MQRSIRQEDSDPVQGLLGFRSIPQISTCISSVWTQEKSPSGLREQPGPHQLPVDRGQQRSYIEGHSPGCWPGPHYSSMPRCSHGGCVGPRHRGNRAAAWQGVRVVTRDAPLHLSCIVFCPHAWGSSHSTQVLGGDPWGRLGGGSVLTSRSLAGPVLGWLQEHPLGKSPGLTTCTWQFAWAPQCPATVSSSLSPSPHQSSHSGGCLASLWVLAGS